MGKSEKNSGKQAGKTGPKKPIVAGERAIRAGSVDAVKKSEKAAEPAVQITEKPSVRTFDAMAYVKSLAWMYPVALVLLMVLMLYFRAGPSADDVFTNWQGNYVNFANDDAVYHMRLVHNAVTHFPERIFFDPFTHYPYGSTTHFGPLFTLMIAGSALILGLGNPSIALVDAVGAYTPAILGMLCAVPTYFIGRKLFGKNVGLTAAFALALLPGPFMGRSMLGFTDHHIAEVLFSAITVMFLVYALDYAKSSGLNLAKIQGRDKGALTALGFGLLAGFSFGLYMLTWPGGLIIGMIIFLYFAIQAIVDHVKGRSLDYLLILATATFAIPGLMVLPYSLTNLHFELVFYSLTQPLFLFGAIAGMGGIYGLSRALNKTTAGSWTFPVALLGLGVAGMLVLYIAAPPIYGLIQAGLQVFTPTGGMTAVAEAQPPDWDHLWAYFLWTFPISILGIALLAFRVFRDSRPAEWLFLVWNLVMLIATLSQDRFSYYFAVNAALLTGYIIYVAFKACDWEKFVESWKKRVKTTNDAQEFLSRHSGQVIVFGVLAVSFLVLVTWPATGLSTVTYSGVLQDPAKYLFYGVTELTAESGTGMSSDWYQTLIWMRDNTPDPQASTFSYDSGSYQKPADGDQYAYPDTAYGVMAWWDYGHMITYVAQRIPNANPFQAGVTSNNNTEGSAPFFLATTEDAGYSNLQKLGSRYVLVSNNDANGYINAMRVWANDHDGWDAYKEFSIFQGQSLRLPVISPKYESTMANRLYYDDCNNLSHLRLVYESPGDYTVNIKLFHTNTGSIDLSQSLRRANYTEAYGYYKDAISPVQASTDGSLIAYDARPPQKWVKLFEVVDGATIKGQAVPGTPVTASLSLTTGDRAFQYVRTAVADQAGNYELTVPYATEAMNGTGYSSNVLPLDKYTLTVGNTTTQVAVSENAVQTGGIIQL